MGELEFDSPSCGLQWVGATLSCELAGSSAASLCSSHPLHGAVELETNRNFCDQGTPASSKSVRKHKISVVDAPNHLMCSCIPLLLLAAAQLLSAPRAHPMLASLRCHGWLAALPRFLKTLFEVKFLRRNLRYHPPSPLFTLSPGCSIVGVWW